MNFLDRLLMISMTYWFRSKAPTNPVPIKAKKQKPSKYTKWKQGWVTNPLKRYPNIKCPCGSEVKAKRCCGLFPILPEPVAEKVRAALK